MAMNKTRVLVVGGGATGVGIIRELALRGIDSVLIEQKDLAHGASFRFHGLLHSGARYASNDLEAAKECIRENTILKKIAPTCINNTGGLYLQHKHDDDNYLEGWLNGCKEAGIETKEIGINEVLKSNPFLTKDLKRAYLVPDGIIDGSSLVWANVYQAVRYGAKVLTYTKLIGILIENNKVVGAEVVNTLTGVKATWECEVIINATGTWADQVVSLAGIELSLVKNKGSLLVFNQRITSQVLNRLRTPSDGDIFVPHHTVTILGTTSINIDNPDTAEPSKKEVNDLLNAGKELIPKIWNYRILRAYSGVRPLYVDNTSKGQDGRTISREFTIIDHGCEDGLSGLLSLVGGKLTTYRLMAEKTVNYVFKIMGENSIDVNPMTPLVELGGINAGSNQHSKVVQRHGERAYLIENYLKKFPDKASVLCECENISYGEVEEVASWDNTHNLDDLRRKTRIGMGTCQGLYCSFRSLGAAWNCFKKKTENPIEYLVDFLENRYKGQKRLLWDSQIRESELTLGVYSTIFNIERSKEKSNEI
ncbi:anaerobic glycerol-3-phosphate dehydrogenase subunit GlpA [Desulfitobacterium sp.]|uniref:anaerobic glycerol-3-phosphate dehydrogenase subunit GlpA n=1 Tax=Desulfitobacterium sp. TaxID=49981 RepID=UPI002B219684|nr:anaerobic glycerol-3-phosphate dehydrogenase subunit GlpA [Desulfitobacterium sp.]MEA4903045.1 anaerobic glycerol-3-phosphate dehydrogenase subunit GlpA [Desulfitobacterium sp.]